MKKLIWTEAVCLIIFMHYIIDDLIFILSPNQTKAQPQNNWKSCKQRLTIHKSHFDSIIGDQKLRHGLSFSSSFKR